MRTSPSTLPICVIVQVMSLGLGTWAMAQSPAVPKGPGSVAGIWHPEGYLSSQYAGSSELVLRTPDGQLPPLQPWAAQLLEDRIKAADSGHPYATTKSQCLPAGVPQVMFGPGLPIQILETRGQVSMLVEEFRNFRIIRMNAQHRQDPDPSYFGDSVGHWEGDTLVVDTIGLTDKTTLDQVGMPHSGELHVVERYRRTSRDRLELAVTIEDPKTFTRPWTAKTSFKWAPKELLVEEICDNNRNPPDAEGRSTIQMPATR
jgi:hypothetical protein